jgi:hypothetical protein
MGYLVPKQTWLRHDLFNGQEILHPMEVVPKQTWPRHDLFNGQGILKPPGASS